MSQYPPQARREISLEFIFSRLWEGKSIIFIGAIAAALLMLIMLPAFSRQYAVSMTVVPTPSDQDSMGRSSGTLSALLSFAGGQQGNSYYLRYQNLLISPIVAERMQKKYGTLQDVFSNQWDKADRKWVQPFTLRNLMLGWLLRLGHIPVWSPPDAIMLSGYLKDHLIIIPSTENDIVSISMQSKDPKFAQKILLQAHEQANAVLRDQVARHASQQVEYLQKKLSGVTIADYRATLLAILSVQEKTLMLTQADAPFAADILSPPLISENPISPRPILFVALSALLGALAGGATTILFGPNWLRRLGRQYRDPKSKGGELAKTAAR